MKTPPDRAHLPKPMALMAPETREEAWLALLSGQDYAPPAPRVHGGPDGRQAFNLPAEGLPAGAAPPVGDAAPMAQDAEFLDFPDAGILDFSANDNPLGAHPAVLAAIAAASTGPVLAHYPDPTARAAREALAGLAHHWGDPTVTPEGVVPAMGSAELLWNIAQLCALKHPGAVVLVARPTFSEFSIAAHTLGLRVMGWSLPVPRGGPSPAEAALHDTAPHDTAPAQPDWSGLHQLVARHQPACVYLCTPNNPTGHHLPMAQAAALARRFPQTLVLADQAYLELSPHHGELGSLPAEPGAHPQPSHWPTPQPPNWPPNWPPNLVRLRSLTKSHGLPGLRVGYALATPALARALGALRPSWPVSAPVQAAMVAAAAHPEHVARTREALLTNRDALAQALTQRGWPPLPSQAPFVLWPVPQALGGANPAQRGQALARALLQRGIRVRDCASFGLGGHVRFSPRAPQDQARLLAALDALNALIASADALAIAHEGGKP